MKYKHLLILFICALALTIVPVQLHATDYPVGSESDNTLSAVLPIVPAASTYTSITQQIYTATDISAPVGGGNITDLTFYYGGKSNNTAVASVTRTIEIWLKETDSDEFEINSTSHKFYFMADKGTKVFDGSFTTGAVVSGNKYSKKVTITPFGYGGSKNLLMTVVDKTNAIYSDGNLRFVLTEKSSDKGHFVHKHWLISNEEDNASDKFTTTYSNLSGQEGEIFSTPNTDAGQKTSHKWVNRITFSISSLSVPSVPTGLAASDETTSSAQISWNAASSATSYELQQSANGEDWSALASSISGTSYSWTGLSASTTYYVRVRAVNAAGNSAWSDGISFSTDAVHSHNGINFEKWNSASSLPTSGNYYLANDVNFAFLDGDVTLTGNLNLCLNGHTANLASSGIVIPDEKTLTIFDNEGGGKITSFFPGQAGAIVSSGLITIQIGGTLVLGEGEIENTYITDEDYSSVAICNQGTLKLSGAPVISSNDIDIFLAPTIPAKVITIESGKPLTNSSPYKVYKSDGVITSGWANMGGADPCDYFVSANPSRVVAFNGSEAELLAAIALNENSSSNESAIAAQSGQLVNVNMTRSTLTNASFNTICLPFGLNNAQLEEIFGAGYDLEEFVSSEIEGDELVLTFNKVTSLVALKPYLLQPANSVTNPEFAGVTIANDEHPLDQTSDTYISFHGVFNPTELTGGNKNLLFLGANNELFWPASTGNIKGFRAYFEVKGAARQARAARIAKREGSATGVGEVQSDKVQGTKILRNGQLYIMYNGTMYDVQGRRIND